MLVNTPAILTTLDSQDKSEEEPVDWKRHKKKKKLKMV